MAFNEPSNKSRLLRLLDKVAQERRPRGVLPRRTDCLLHGGELPVEEARAGARLRDRQQARAQPGIGVHLLAVELLERGVGAVELQQLRLLDVVFEPEAVGASRSYRNSLSGLVDLSDIADRGARRHEIGRFNLAIG